MKCALYKTREFDDFRQFLNEGVSLYGDSPAFKVKNKKGEIIDVSYEQFRDDINSLGTALTKLGLKDCRVAVAGANSYKWCVSYMSVVCGLGVVVPTDKELPFNDIKSIIEVSESRAIIFDESFGGKLLEHRDELPEDLIYICMNTEADEDGVLSFDRLLENGKRLVSDGNTDYTDAEINGNKLTVLLFTSGTTGMSKAVMLSARNICSDISSIMGIVKINKGERIMSILPLHHTYECTVTFLCCVYGGVTICFCDGIRYITKNLEEYKPNILIVVPLILERFYSRIQKAVESEKGSKAKVGLGSAISRITKAVGYDSSDLFFGKIKKAFGGEIRLIISGAAGIEPDIIKNMNKYGIRTFQGYGLTECSPIIICNSDKVNKYDSIGRPLPGVEIKLHNSDEDGVGEICAKGPMIMLGYYKDEDATNAVFDDDGWFHTGDLGRVDKKGNYYICGRCKSVIVTGNGKNVYPEELEALLTREDCVQECMVVGAEDERGSTIVKARIYPDLRAISEKYGKQPDREEIEKCVSEAVKRVNANLVVYKTIKKFEVTEQPFEKTTTSKIKRNQ